MAVVGEVTVETVRCGAGGKVDSRGFEGIENPEQCSAK